MFYKVIVFDANRPLNDPFILKKHYFSEEPDFNYIHFMEKVSAAQYFDDKFPQPESEITLLPVFHSCDAFTLRSILEEKKISLAECPVFIGERLLYLFYGRPAYRNRDAQTNALNSFFPISIMMDWDGIPLVKRIAPFDTGAFMAGLFKDYMHPKMKIENFLIRPEKASSIKTTNFFFGKNNAYFAGRPKETIPFGAFDFEIESYYHMLKGVASQPADDRKSTIEIQLDREVTLTKENVKAIIMPSEFEDTEMVEEVVLNELQAQPIYYESYGVPSADNYTHLLSLAKGFLMKNKYLANI